jgi:hypothetical protein
MANRENSVNPLAVAGKALSAGELCLTSAGATQDADVEDGTPTAHHGEMKVVARSADGSWDMWRVGRRRLAFIPRIPEWMGTLMGADDWLGLAGAVLTATTFGVVWTAVLLATAVVWPWRELKGDWPVVAYPTTGGPLGGMKAWCVTVTGKANADALVQRWAREIKDGGEPVSAALKIET